MANTVAFAGLQLLADAGVKFPATAVADADPNTLDDYAEGTFTPALTFGGGATGMTFSARSGAYTKVGRLVFFQLDLTLSAKGSSTGNVLVTGLPITPSSVYAAVSIGFVTGLASITGQICGVVRQGSTTIELDQIVSSTTANLTHANFTDTGRLVLSGVYAAA